MKKERRKFCGMAWVLALVLLLTLTGCEKQAPEETTPETTMHLRQTQGTVEVSDGEKTLELTEQMGLYSGYHISTSADSYAWLELESGKQIKLDQNSSLVLKQEEQALELTVDQGSLFFYVTQPLAQQETMVIQTAVLTAQLHGTSGWIEAEGGLYLLEGQVDCVAGQKNAVLTAGQWVSVTAEGELALEPLTADLLPDFVMEEAKEGVLQQAIEQLPQPQDPVQDALAQYRQIVGQAESYDYDNLMEPTGVYRYALAQMQKQAEQPIPALLLEQQTDFGIGYIRAFQYQPEQETVVQAEGILMQGVGEVGGYRGSLCAAGDGIGLLSSEFSSGSGQGSEVRITLAENRLQNETLWQGFIFDDTNHVGEEVGYLDLVWYDSKDLSGLESWTPGEIPAAPAETPAANDIPAPPAEENRITVTGTISLYTYEEVLALQGMPDPNPGDHSGETFRLLVLDEPQVACLIGVEGPYEAEMRLIDITHAEGMEQYDGRHLTCSIDPEHTHWPSDTSLPLGEPSTSDIHVIG